MTELQKKIAASLAIMFLIAAVALSLSLAVLTSRESFTTSQGIDAELLLPWRVAKWFMLNGTGVNLLFGGVISILTTGAGWISGVYREPYQLITLVALGVIGILSAAWVILFISPDGINQLRTFGGSFGGRGLNDALAAARAALHGFEGGLIGWFSLYLASILGMSAAANQKIQNGVRKLWERVATGNRSTTT